MKSVELFAGAGGLALGVAKAGFDHVGIFEWDDYACSTIEENIRLKHRLVKEWPSVAPVDVKNIDYSKLLLKSSLGVGDLDLLSAGPPCQPFSLAGKHRGHLDKRDMFPEVIRAVREMRPKVLLVENVKGLWRKSFADYREYIELQLMFPDEIQKRSEDTEAHLGRLRKLSVNGSKNQIYELKVSLLNAANYGVPQTRERVIFVGFRKDLGVNWKFPVHTHSLDALLVDQWITGAYWERHQVPTRLRPAVPRKFAGRVRALKKLVASGMLLGPDIDKGLPWMTVRDMMRDGRPLPDPYREAKKAKQFLNHEYIDGARVYVGHTGSPVDLPAKTLKAGDHGVPGGENMLCWPGNRTDKYRYFTVREAARLQTFPDDYRISGSWTEVMRQIGNAVPVRLAEVLATSIKNHLESVKTTRLRRALEVEIETEAPREKIAV